ncbi:MAG: DNA alkylation repair protein [Roseobacter sp.]
MVEKFSLKDHLFNAETVGQLAREFGTAVSDFDSERFEREALSGFDERELMARMEWMADCIQCQLNPDFEQMALQLEAAMPPPLDPTLKDDDFGHFIHAIPGILAVRHGMETHRERAMELLYRATQRFSMEFYIRPFLVRWPSQTLDTLRTWAGDENYHVRRLVSEGTRPKLPWAKAVNLDANQTLPLLGLLYGDPTRFVTRSVANHLNDLSKKEPDKVLATLAGWKAEGGQDKKELDWITRHALRTLIKSGHPGAMEALGFQLNAPLQVKLDIKTPDVAIGDSLIFDCDIASEQDMPILVDYRIEFSRPNGRSAEKVFKLKQSQVGPKRAFKVTKTHKLKANASTFTWHPGIHSLILQINGADRQEATFTVV